VRGKAPGVAYVPPGERGWHPTDPGPGGCYARFRCARGAGCRSNGDRPQRDLVRVEVARGRQPMRPVRKPDAGSACERRTRTQPSARCCARPGARRPTPPQRGSAERTANRTQGAHAYRDAHPLLPVRTAPSLRAKGVVPTMEPETNVTAPTSGGSDEAAERAAAFKRGAPIPKKAAVKKVAARPRSAAKPAPIDEPTAPAATRSEPEKLARPPRAPRAPRAPRPERAETDVIAQRRAVRGRRIARGRDRIPPTSPAPPGRPWSRSRRRQAGRGRHR
jgi:hypothetical protein